MNVSAIAFATGPTPILAKADAADITGLLDDAQTDGIAWAIIDSPPHNAPLIGSLMSRATITLVPVRPGPFDLAAIGATLNMARSLKAPVACLVNAAATDHARRGRDYHCRRGTRRPHRHGRARLTRPGLTAR